MLALLRRYASDGHRIKYLRYDPFLHFEQDQWPAIGFQPQHPTFPYPVGQACTSFLFCYFFQSEGCFEAERVGSISLPGASDRRRRRARLGGGRRRFRGRRRRRHRLAFGTALHRCRLQRPVRCPHQTHPIQ